MKKYNILYPINIVQSNRTLSALLLVIKFLVVIFLITSCNQSNKRSAANKQNKAYTQNNGQFIQFYILNYIKTKSIRVLDNPGVISLKCYESLPSSFDGGLISWPANQKNDLRWEKDELGKSERISITENKKAFELMPFYIFSKPILSIDGNFLAFYSEYHCGDRCGYGMLMLFRKKLATWEKVGTFCESQS